MIKNYTTVVTAIITECKNWVRIIYSKLAKRPLEYIMLRSGVKIFVGDRIGKADLSMFAEIWHHHFYTPSGFNITETDIVFDVGANNGFFSAYAAYKAPYGQVYAFEPVPYLAEKIEKTKSINKFSNLHIANTAIGKEVGTSTFYISKDHNGCHSLYKRAGTQEEISVPVIDLETYCREHAIPKIDFLKLDCEGAEYDIITPEQMEFIKKTVAIISMEFHDTIRTETHEILVQRLSTAGFTLALSGDYLYAKNTHL